MSQKVQISGYGVISALGLNSEENFNSLLNGKHGISEPSILDTKLKNKYPVGEIKKTNVELMNLAGKEFPAKDNPRTLILASIALSEAINNSGTDPNNELKTGLILGTTVAGMDKTERYFNIPGTEKDYVCSHHYEYNTRVLAHQFNVKHFYTGISTACSSGANAIMLGARMIKNGLLDRVYVGGSDALSKFTLNGFSSLMILDENHCKTFDNNRQGLNLGEGAAFLVLESETAMGGRKPVAFVSGYANADDAHHQTASSSEGKGAYLSMVKAIQSASLSIQDIDYINAHGTGTNNNDLSESVAFKRVFSVDMPDFSSTKGFTGHTLGAAGAIEAVFSVFAINNNVAMPNLNFLQPIEETGLKPLSSLKKKQINNVMSNSFGFGGNNTTLIISGV
jgi:3-oxoacyl-[acyl-carrier-protein] synthase-1